MFRFSREQEVKVVSPFPESAAAHRFFLFQRFQSITRCFNSLTIKMCVQKIWLQTISQLDEGDSRRALLIVRR